MMISFFGSFAALIFAATDGQMRCKGAPMRTFDYRRVPGKMLEGKTRAAVSLVYQDKGKLDLLAGMHGDQLRELEETAFANTVRSSTAIEGLYVDASRVQELLGGAEAENETEHQVIGFSRALRMVEERAADLELSTSTVLKLFETMYGHRNLGRKSRYRKKDYMYVQVDGHVQAMPVSPITAFETPLVLGGACDSLAEAFEQQSCDPLLLNILFTVDFLCIRPFDEGNGRVSRLFSELLLRKSGFDVGRYVSIDRLMEESAADYYDSLNNCVNGWDRGMNDCTPYALYWLGVLHAAYEKLFDALDLRVDAGSKSERVRLFVQRADGPVTKRQIKQEFPDISEATVENALGQMVKDGAVEKLGAGRATSYRWIG